MAGETHRSNIRLAIFFTAMQLCVSACTGPTRNIPSPKERADAQTLAKSLQDAGGITRYSCENHEAYITTATWQQANADTKRAIAVMFAAACNGDNMTVFDSQSGKPLARVGALGYSVE